MVQDVRFGSGGGGLPSCSDDLGSMSSLYCAAYILLHVYNELNLMTQSKIAIFPTQAVLCAELLRNDCFSGYRGRQE